MSTNITKIFLVLNSGASREKFSLYEGEDEVCSLYLGGSVSLIDVASVIFILLLFLLF